MRVGSLLLIFFLLCSMSLLSGQEESDDLSGLLGGFDTDEPLAVIIEDSPSVSEPVTASIFSVDGSIWIKSGWAYAFMEDESVPFDRGGLSGLKTGVYLHTRLNLDNNWYAEVSGKVYTDFVYMIKGDDEFTSRQIEEFRQEALLHEAFIAGSFLPDWEIRAGRQIFSFGKSDQIQILDRLNPLNMREPGLQEIRDLKLPVGSIRLSWNAPAGFSLTGVIVPELRQAELPVYGSEFYPGGSSVPRDLWPDSGENEYLFSVDLRLGGWDLSVVYEYLLWDIPGIEISTEGLSWVYDRVHVLGTAAETALGPIVLTMEGAFIRGFHFQGDPGTDYSRIDLMAGVNWQAPLELSVGLEVCRRAYFGLDDSILLPSEIEETEAWEAGLRLSRGFFHERLKFNLSSMLKGMEIESGGIVRLDAEWELSDGIKAKLSWADYLEGESGMLKGAGDNDRIILSINRSF